MEKEESTDHIQSDSIVRANTVDSGNKYFRPEPANCRTLYLTVAGCVLLLSLLVAGACDEGPDTEPPAQIIGITATVGDSVITITWTAAVAGDLWHYLLYQGTSASSLTSTGEEIITNTRSLSNLTEGTTYYFYVTAVDDSGNESEPSLTVDGRFTSSDYETGLGWSEFETGAYNDALPYFNAAVELDANHADAYSGIGWSQAMLGSLSESATAFQTAGTYGLTTQDANAGLAVVYRDLPSLTNAISRASSVITNEPSYVFSHCTSIDYQDMHLVMAQCHFRLGEANFPDAQAQVDILDPDNGLDPDTPGTWVVDGQAYQTYAEALLMEIESLEASIGG